MKRIRFFLGVICLFPFYAFSPLFPSTALDAAQNWNKQLTEALNSGVSISDLLNMGTSVADLLAVGVTADQLYGLPYEGGLIFYVDEESGDGLIASSSDIPLVLGWGCYQDVSLVPNVTNIVVNPASMDGAQIGDGATNTQHIIDQCPVGSIRSQGRGQAVERVVSYSEAGFEDWFMPSILELREMYQNIGPGANSPNVNTGNFAEDTFWSSTEKDRDEVWCFDFSRGNTFVSRKLDRGRAGVHYVRPVRAFSAPSATERSFQTDVLLAQSICQCNGTLSPFLINSALSNGYSTADLLAAGLDVSSLLDAGVSVPDLLAAGVRVEAFYGLTYAGGFIFYIDPATGQGMVAAPEDQGVEKWGCTSVPLVSDCPTASGLAVRYTGGGFTDWTLPSLVDLNRMYQQIGPGAPAPNTNVGNFMPQLYWSATESDALNAFLLDFNTGMELGGPKEIGLAQVRAVRGF